MYMAYIDIIDSNGNDYRYPLPEDGSVLLIGSGEECSISLPHIADLQPQHCSIALQEQGYVVTVAAENATLLAENEATTSAVLVSGATYSLGSAMLLYGEGEIPAAEPVEETPAEDEPGEEVPSAPRKKKKIRTASGGSPLRETALYTEEESALHIILRRLYILAVLAAAFLAGLTMRYWMMTGDFLIDELLK